MTNGSSGHRHCRVNGPLPSVIRSESFVIRHSYSSLVIRSSHDVLPHPRRAAGRDGWRDPPRIPASCAAPSPGAQPGRRRGRAARSAGSSRRTRRSSIRIADGGTTPAMSRAAAPGPVPEATTVRVRGVRLHGAGRRARRRRRSATCSPTSCARRPNRLSSGETRLGPARRRARAARGRDSGGGGARHRSPAVDRCRVCAGSGRLETLRRGRAPIAGAGS